MDTPPRRYGGDRLGVRVGEEQALLSEGVEVRSLDPAVAVGADVIPSQTVYDHQGYVQAVLPPSIHFLAPPPQRPIIQHDLAAIARRYPQPIESCHPRPCDANFYRTHPGGGGSTGWISDENPPSRDAPVLRDPAV